MFGQGGPGEVDYGVFTAGNILVSNGQAMLTDFIATAERSVDSGIAVISPPLDAAGNSVRAQKAIADISNALGGNPFSFSPQ